MRWCLAQLLVLVLVLVLGGSCFSPKEVAFGSEIESPGCGAFRVDSDTYESVANVLGVPTLRTTTSHDEGAVAEWSRGVFIFDGPHTRIVYDYYLRCEFDALGVLRSCEEGGKSIRRGE